MSRMAKREAWRCSSLRSAGPALCLRFFFSPAARPARGVRSVYRKFSRNVTVPPGASVCVGAAVTLWSVAPGGPPDAYASV